MKRMFFLALVAAWVIVGGFGADVHTAQATPVPLPSTIPLLGLGLALLSASRRRNK